MIERKNKMCNDYYYSNEIYSQRQVVYFNSNGEIKSIEIVEKEIEYFLYELEMELREKIDILTARANNDVMEMLLAAKNRGIDIKKFENIRIDYCDNQRLDVKYAIGMVEEILFDERKREEK
jgi:hypothetical protein